MDGEGLLVRVASPPGACDKADDNDSITMTFTIPVGTMQVLGQSVGPQHETTHTGQVVGGTLLSSQTGAVNPQGDMLSTGDQAAIGAVT